jgi:hypothetical protein
MCKWCEYVAWDIEKPVSQFVMEFVESEAYRDLLHRDNRIEDKLDRFECLRAIAEHEGRLRDAALAALQSTWQYRPYDANKSDAEKYGYRDVLIHANRLYRAALAKGQLNFDDKLMCVDVYRRSLDFHDAEQLVHELIKEYGSLARRTNEQPYASILAMQVKLLAERWFGVVSVDEADRFYEAIQQRVPNEDDRPVPWEQCPDCRLIFTMNVERTRPVPDRIRE